MILSLVSWAGLPYDQSGSRARQRVTHLGSVTVGGESREGWIGGGTKERTKKGGRGESSLPVVSAVRHLFGWTMYFCILENPADLPREAFTVGGRALSCMEITNLQFINKSVQGCGVLVGFFPHVHYFTLIVLEFHWWFYCLVIQHHAV